jgi:hypothetical protein
MNLTERQALRDKHQQSDRSLICKHCVDQYPCDVIKLLDATKPEECLENHEFLQKKHFNFCNGCGEKL